MVTRSEPFSLEMLTFGHPESSGALAGGGRDAGRPQATETVPFSLEMPTFGHPESSGTLGRRRLATQRAPGALGRRRPTLGG